MSSTTKFQILAQEFAAAAAAKTRPSIWPLPNLHAWACNALPRVVSAIDAECLVFQTTHWPDLYDTKGAFRIETFRDFALWMDYTSTLSVGNKHAVPAWSAGRFRDNCRADGATEAIFALVIDCDDGGARDQLLTALHSVGLAFLAHDTPSHGTLAADGVRRLDKWRVVIPLAHPICGADLALYRNAYTAARLLLAAVGNIWLDHTTHNPSRLWFAASAVGDAPARRVEYSPGRALDLGRLLGLAPERPASPPQPSARPVRTGGNAARGRSYLLTTGPATLGSRNETAFRLALRLVDTIGCDEQLACDLLVEWNGRNAQPLPDWELRACVINAIRASAKGNTTP